MKATIYRWVWGDPDMTTRLLAVGIREDGTLHNPNGYPDETVRAAVLAANERRHARRSHAAQQATETRRRRQAARVLLLGYWSELDILVNPFESTAYAKGNVQIRGMITMDVKLRHVASFAAIKDLTTT